MEEEQVKKVLSAASDIEFYKTLQTVLFVFSALCFFIVGYFVLNNERREGLGTLSLVGISFSIGAVSVMVLRMFIINSLSKKIKKVSDHE